MLLRRTVCATIFAYVNAQFSLFLSRSSHYNKNVLYYKVLAWVRDLPYTSYGTAQ